MVMKGNRPMPDYELIDEYLAKLTREFHHNALALPLLNLVPGYSKAFHRGSICALKITTHIFL